MEQQEARHGTAQPDRAESAQHWATASFVLGIAGLCLFWLVGVGVILGLLAVILGAVAMRSAKRVGDPVGRAKAGVVLGLIATVASAAVIAVLMPWTVDVESDLEPVPDPRFAPVEPTEGE